VALKNVSITGLNELYLNLIARKVSSRFATYYWNWLWQLAYKNKVPAQPQAAPALAYFHIPLPEFSNLGPSDFTGVKQEGISSARINSGFLTTLLENGDVKAAFVGHDHVNDFCGDVHGVCWLHPLDFCLLFRPFGGVMHNILS